jgi:RNA polymerase subunit RPABC4/transcription elongation factor Spt4/predicted Zn-dependent protease
VLLRIRLPKNWLIKGREIRVVADEVKCPECNYIIKPDDKFCGHCHAVILRRYCQPCKRLVPDHTEFCPYCHASAKEKRKTRNLMPLTNIAMVGVLLLVTILFWPDPTPEQKSPAQQSNRPSVTTTPRPGVQIASTTNKSEAVKPVVEAVPEKNPQTGIRLNLKGHSMIQQGRYHEAVSLLYQSIKSFPEGSNMIEYFFAQYNLGHSLRKIGKSEEAIPYLERCVAYDRQNQMFKNELAAARRDVQRKENY